MKKHVTILLTAGIVLLGMLQTATAQTLTVTLTPSNHNGFNVSCFGGIDGSINATVTGGNAPYSYLWSNGATTQNITGLASGYYNLVVKDFSGTISQRNEVTLTAPQTLRLTPSIYEYPNGYNISLYNAYNGSIAINITGGVTNYSYLWDDGTVTQNRASLGAGAYIVTVTDANACTVKSEQINLRQPDRVDWAVSGNTGSNPTTNFIGTKDSVDLVFRTNNSEKFRIGANGNINVNQNLNIQNYLSFKNDRYIGYQPAFGNNREIMSFGALPNNNIWSLPLCWPPSLYTTYQFNGQMQSWGNFPVNVGGNLATMTFGFDGANFIVDGNGTASGDPTMGRLLLNYYCGHDIFMCTGPNGGNLYACTGGTGAMIQLGGANSIVGIGIDPNEIVTLSTPYKLVVAGKLGANEIWTSLGTNSTWPDYVFKKDYKLKSLIELEKYVKTKSHLPGMPSSKDIAARDKFNLGEMQVKLLEKTEENTLYILQLKKENDALQAQIEQLQYEIKQLSNQYKNKPLKTK